MSEEEIDILQLMNLYDTEIKEGSFIKPKKGTSWHFQHNVGVIFLTTKDILEVVMVRDEYLAAIYVDIRGRKNRCSIGIDEIDEYFSKVYSND